MPLVLGIRDALRTGEAGEVCAFEALRLRRGAGPGRVGLSAQALVTCLRQIQQAWFFSVGVRGIAPCLP